MVRCGVPVGWPACDTVCIARAVPYLTSTCPQDIIWLCGVATKPPDAKDMAWLWLPRLALPMYSTFWQGLVWRPSGVATKLQDTYQVRHGFSHRQLWLPLLTPTTEKRYHGVDLRIVLS